MKVIIWGHKLHSHTHSYVHYGYYNAAKYLGHETYWLDDYDDVSGVDFKDAVFITEHNVCKKMPQREDCKYFIHWSDLAFQHDRRSRYCDMLKNDWSGFDVYNFVFEAKHWEYGEGYEWPNVEKIGSSYYHDDSKTLVTRWATDLLPFEIDKIEPKTYDDTLDDVYFVGSMQGKNISHFSEVVTRNNKNFVNIGGYTGINRLGMNPPDRNNNIDLIRKSYISFDIREDVFLNKGYYYPCRVFKNISYGKWTGCNQPALKEEFGDFLTCESDLDTLYNAIVEDYKKCSKEKMKQAMNFVRDNHTYINRLNDLLGVIS